MGKSIIKPLNKLFGGINLSWLKVIIFAVCTGVYTGIINQIPFLKGSSFQDIAISLECWILFAVIIAANSKKWWESALKIFVFFLISQPIIYLVELPTVALSQSIKYYMGYWFWVTLLTLPGGAIAFFIQKKNVISSLILAVATGLLAFLMVEYILIGHILSALVCLMQIIVYLIVFTPKLKTKLITGIITLAFAVGALLLILTQSNTVSMPLPKGNWTSCELTVSDGSRVELDLDSFVYYYNGYTAKDKQIIFTSDDGRTVTYEFKDGELIPPAELKE